MRKALILLMVFAMVGAVAFAEGPVAKWAIGVRTGLGIVTNDVGSTVEAYDYSRIGGDRVRFGFTLTAADGNSGFNSRLQMTDPMTAPAAFNQLNGWAKFFGGMLTVRAGILDDYTIATQDWEGFGNTDGALGIYFNVSPISGLNIGYFQPIPAASIDVADVYNGSILGAAYNIEGIGSLQVGAVLASAATATSGTALYAGFNLSAVKDLTAIIEASFTLADGDTPMTFVENVGYAMGNLSVGVRAGETINSADTFWGFEPTVSYKINDNLKVAAIGNVYNNKVAHVTMFMSPINAGVVSAGVAGDVNFGGGASVSYSAGGFTLTLGDFYAAADGENVVYLNADLSL